MNYASGVLNFLKAVNHKTYIMYFSCGPGVKVEFVKTYCSALMRASTAFDPVKPYIKRVNRKVGEGS